MFIYYLHKYVLNFINYIDFGKITHRKFSITVMCSSDVPGGVSIIR